MNHTFCQSCGMPIDDPALRGTERGGTPSEHYCKYCYQEGAFTGEMTMEEMIDFCTPMMVRANPELTPEQARAQMAQFFPRLLRWRKYWTGTPSIPGRRSPPRSSSPPMYPIRCGSH